MQKIGNCFIATENDVDKLEFNWGVIHILAKESMTGSGSFSFGHVVLQPGQGHVRHNHPTADEVIYVLSGEAEQMLDDAPAVKVKAGDCIWIPKAVYHSTINTGREPVILIVVYSPAGAEQVLWDEPTVKITPPQG
jgi:oxalate decarboxylase/phosphoglucose isomerase-like protein (cupin superfamily)